MGTKVNYLELLKQWGDALLRLQIRKMDDPSLDGGILCPACKHIHGRCPDAIYGLMTLADRTGEKKYLDGARALFRWQENLLCDDGSLYNDANSEWNGITAFAVINLCEALTFHGHLLQRAEKEEWENRMRLMGRWVEKTIVPGFETNINYYAGSAAVQALLGRYFGCQELLESARKCAEYVRTHFTENGLLVGEGIPHDKVTERGCRPVDIGYNVEESVPLMIRYALAAEDEPLLEQLTHILQQQLEFMMPDGGWDNSFGTRNNKWTYWGSRTSDGCQTGYALLADRDPVFAEALGRNTALLERCTDNGLLYGGPEYRKYGEPPCVHHTFTHINALAAVVDAGIDGYEPDRDPGVGRNPQPLPSDNRGPFIHYFPEIDTWKLTFEKWRVTVTGYDFGLEKGHASGGTMTLLWHEDMGPVLLSSVVDYRLVEPLNMQLSLKKSRHRPLTPRLEILRNGKRYASCYDTKAEISVMQEKDGIRIHVLSRPISLEQEELSKLVRFRIDYWLHKEGLSIRTQIEGPKEEVRLVLPVIAGNASVTAGRQEAETEPVFFLTGGFGAREFVILPDEEGVIGVEISCG